MYLRTAVNSYSQATTIHRLVRWHICCVRLMITTSQYSKDDKNCLFMTSADALPRAHTERWKISKASQTTICRQCCTWHGFCTRLLLNLKNMQTWHFYHIIVVAIVRRLSFHRLFTGFCTHYFRMSYLHLLFSLSLYFLHLLNVNLMENWIWSDFHFPT